MVFKGACCHGNAAKWALSLICREVGFFGNSKLRLPTGCQCRSGLFREIIAQTKYEYAQDDTVTPGLLWEMIKIKTREASISYGKIKKRNLEQKTK